MDNDNIKINTFSYENNSCSYGVPELKNNNSINMIKKIEKFSKNNEINIKPIEENKEIESNNRKFENEDDNEEDKSSYKEDENEDEYKKWINFKEVKKNKNKKSTNELICSLIKKNIKLNHSKINRIASL